MAVTHLLNTLVMDFLKQMPLYTWVNILEDKFLPTGLLAGAMVVVHF